MSLCLNQDKCLALLQEISNYFELNLQYYQRKVRSLDNYRLNFKVKMSRYFNWNKRLAQMQETHINSI